MLFILSFISFKLHQYDEKDSKVDASLFIFGAI